YLYQLKQAVPTDVPKYYVVAGILNEKEARWAQARTYVERALELDPGNIDAQRLQLRLDGKR
ncbi:MAG TPA: hypothetical protein DCP28_10740, partial [Cytophagales bacterium]|nr:hypothetical protein [Cytophagales bacterium]